MERLCPYVSVNNNLLIYFQRRFILIFSYLLIQFPPCKRFYNPYDNEGTRMYACRLHSKLRMKRYENEGRIWRVGEKPLDDFWKRCGDNVDAICDNVTSKHEPA